MSTDKACQPVNVYGSSKFIAERLFTNYDYNASTRTIFSSVRYGNVIASRGSVIPLFINQLKSGTPITITDPKMTRFMMTLEQSVDLVLHAFLNGKNGQIFVQKSPSATIETISGKKVGIRVLIESKWLSGKI